MSQPAGGRISVVIRHVIWVGLVAHTGFIFLFWWLGHPALAAFNIVSVASWAAASFANARGRVSLAMWLLVAEVVVHAVLATMTLGWSSGFQYYLIPLIPFVMFNDQLRTLTVFLVSAGVLVAFARLQALAPVLPLDPRVAPLITYSNIVIPFIALALVTFYFRLASVTAEQHMETMAVTDSLTGLFNRRHMQRLLDSAADTFTKKGEPFCVIMADLDRFKQVNDNHGHAVGDRVLTAVGAILIEALRSADSVARWGGEEFLVLLSGTSLDKAADIAERLRTAVEQSLPQRVSLAQGVTLTLGLAAATGSAHEAAEVINAADAALYRGKEAGRNRVVVAPARAA